MSTMIHATTQQFLNALGTTTAMHAAARSRRAPDPAKVLREKQAKLAVQRRAEIGQRARSRRLQMGLSRIQVAKFCALSLATIDFLENGRWVTLQSLQRVQRELAPAGWPEWLLGEKDHDAASPS